MSRWPESRSRAGQSSGALIGREGRRPRLLVLAIATSLVLGVGVVGGSFAAWSVADQSSGDSLKTTTWNAFTENTAGTYTLLVPAATTSFTFTLTGAGGGGSSSAGGSGGSVSGAITLASNPSGTTLTVVVGGGGGSSGTAGTGGTGCAAGGAGGAGTTTAGAGGGGATCVYSTSGQPIVVAGGGGGGAGTGGQSANSTPGAGAAGSGTTPASTGVNDSSGTDKGGAGGASGTGGAGGSGCASACNGSAGGTAGAAGGAGGGGKISGGGGGGGGFASGGGGGGGQTVGSVSDSGAGGGGGCGSSAGQTGFTVSGVTTGTGSGTQGGGGAASTNGSSGYAVFGLGTSSPLVYESRGTATTWSASSAAKSVSYPSGTQTDDLLFLVLENTANSASPTVSGWTKIADEGQTSFHFTLWWKLSAGETSVSVTPTASSTMTAWVVDINRTSGYPPNPAVATTTVQQGNAAAASTLTPSPNVTTNQAFATVISFAGIKAANTLSLSTAQGFTFQSQTNSGGVALGIATQFVAASGGSDTSPTWSQSGTAAVWGWATVAFD
jgi:hypothetical protein